MNIKRILIKIINSAYNCLNYSKKFMLRLFSYPLHFGGYDYYPSANYLSDALPLSRKWGLSPSKRISFWTKICKKFEPFKPFYFKGGEELYLNTIDLKNNPLSIDDYIELYETGVVVKENFFSDEQYRLISNCFEQAFMHKNAGETYFARKQVHDVRVNHLLDNAVLPIEKVLFGKTIGQGSYTMQKFSVCDGKSIYKDSINWHQDRFIPCYKIFYFPKDVVTSPLEYYLGSHFVDEQYISNAHITASKSSGVAFDLFDYTNYKKKSLYVKSNSLVISATNGFHRRLDENKDGEREFITINYYKSFTRYDLLSNYVRKKIRLK